MKDFLGNYSHIVKGALAVAFILFLFYIGSGMRTGIDVEDISKLDANSTALESEGWPYPTEEEVRFVHPPQDDEEYKLAPLYERRPVGRDTVVVEMIEDTNESKVEAFGAELVSETEKIEQEESPDTNEVEVDTVEVKVDTVVVETDTTVTDTTKNQ